MIRQIRLFSFLALLAIVLTACPAAAPAAPATMPAEQAAPATADLLADITARGVLRVSTDPAYPPQSELVADAKKADNSKCGGEEHTVNEFSGFDIDVAAEIAKRMGVELCFVTPAWELIVGGKWSGRWDLSIGSVTITPERMQALYFAQPYYTTPAAFFIQADNTTFTKPEDLSGKTIGACSGCTYETYLEGALEIPGETINLVVKDATVNGVETDINALEDLVNGRVDAVLTALPTGQGFMNDGKPIKQLGDAVFFEYLAPAIDRDSALDPTSFRNKVTELIQAMFEDGTLKTLSEKYYGTDLVSGAAAFDLAGLSQ